MVLFISSLVAILVFSSADHRWHFRSLRYAGAQGSNFFFAENSGYFDVSNQSKSLLHTWSLGVEEQFYLFWPILLLERSKASPVTPIILISTPTDRSISFLISTTPSNKVKSGPLNFSGHLPLRFSPPRPLRSYRPRRSPPCETCREVDPPREERPPLSLLRESLSFSE